MSEGRITAIETIDEYAIQPVAPLHGTGGARLGLGSMIEALIGRSSMEGYQVTTDEHVFHVLISSGQSCCETYGYLSSDDDFGKFIGAQLLEVVLTDTALNKKRVVKEISDWRDDGEIYLDEGGIQFVDFVTNVGRLQLAVYNSHNGYYGHGVLVARDDEILFNETL